MKPEKIPPVFKPFLWSKNTEKLDKEKDKVYIIHQILSYGDVSEVRQLLRIYDKKEVRETFVKYPKKIYQPSVFYFTKNFVLGLERKRLKEENYVKTFF